MNNWIPVTEKLPQWNEDVFVCDVNARDAGIGWFKKARNKRGWKCESSTNTGYDGEWLDDPGITHWMPIEFPQKTE